VGRLEPYPFAGLVRRLFRELERKQEIFDLPASRFFAGEPGLDFSVRFQGHRASTPLGPAAGPQSQLAQNIVLSWLGGSRIIELKTVQVLDELEIPRPCIEMETVGFNIEWSQELKLEQSLEEYVKASMLIDMVAASGHLPLAPGMADTVFDMSVGYDLAGISGDRVGAFIRGMLDARPVVDRLRRQIPDELKPQRDAGFRRTLSDTLTLSTFHGCPAGEIERILVYLMETFHLHTVVKLNPTLLGRGETRRVLNEVLGYHDIRVADAAFERDTTWEQAAGFVERLARRAASLGLAFGVKFSNTLVVENTRPFFPANEREIFLSGPPLHVLAIQLVDRFRRHFGAGIPISFSAGIDRHNFPDAVALGLVPVTVCTDLLKPGGYGRARGYFDALAGRMRAVGATTIEQFIARWADARSDGPFHAERGTDGSLEETVLANTREYARRVLADERYTRPHNAKPPRKIGRRLKLFDCLTCDKCIPVCPNDANFTFVMPRLVVPIVKLTPEDGAWRARQEGTLAISEKHQIGNIADLCNDCGNCDVFCPEDGGPYVLKPRFFLSLARWERPGAGDGFCVEQDRGGWSRTWARAGDLEFSCVEGPGTIRYSGPGFNVTLSAADITRVVDGQSEGEVDLTWLEIMRRVRDAVLADGEINYISWHGVDDRLRPPPANRMDKALPDWC
jgi:putative selenate reductase